MSWSVSLVGSVEGIKVSLDAQGERLTGSSREEFDAAKPALVSLLDLNSNVGAAYHLDANGHAYMDGDRKVSSCAVSLRCVGVLALA